MIKITKKIALFLRIALTIIFGASLIGRYIALVRFGECNERAQEALADCRANQNR